MTAQEKAEEWLSQEIDQDFKAGIQQLIDEGGNELEDAFYKDLEFGTGGMRGVMGIGSNRINRYTLGMATQGLCNYIKQSSSDQKNLRIAIAYDCRNNSANFAQLVADIISANGMEAYLFSELRPTPELSFAVRHHQCQAGIVITASHNPPEYNGFKVYWNDGAQIVTPHDQNIINEVRSIKDLSAIQFESNTELITYLGDETDEAFIEASLNQRKTKETNPLKIVFTPLHGTSITIMPKLLKRAGYTDLHIIEEQATPDGNFPTVESPNPEERAALDMALKRADEIDADMVIGTDPDSDRLGVAIRDANGKMQLLNGNQCGALLTEYLLANSNLSGDEFIAYTIVSSEIFADIAVDHGIQSEVCLTGFKHIAALIRENEGSRKFIGGGEESYGFMVGDFVRDKDALTSTLIFCDLASEAKAIGSSAFEMLCSLYKKHGFYQEYLISVTKKGAEGAKAIDQLMQGYRSNPPAAFGDDMVARINDMLTSESKNVEDGTSHSINLPKSNVLQFFTEKGNKVSVRPSGTEPKIKYYFSLKATWSRDKSMEEQEKRLEDSLSQILKALKIT